MFWTKICVPQPPDEIERRGVARAQMKNVPEPPFWTDRPQPPKIRPTRPASNRKQPLSSREKMHVWTRSQGQASKEPGVVFASPRTCDSVAGARKGQRKPQNDRHHMRSNTDFLNQSMRSHTLRAVVGELQNMHTASREKQRRTPQNRTRQNRNAARPSSQRTRDATNHRCRANRPQSAPVFGSATAQRHCWRVARAEERACAEKKRLDEPNAHIRFAQKQHMRTKSAFSRSTFDKPRPGTEYLKGETIAAVNGLRPSKGNSNPSEPKLRWEIRPLHRLEYVQYKDVRPHASIMPSDGTHWREGILASQYAPP
jgi:hypothetical protein